MARKRKAVADPPSSRDNRARSQSSAHSASNSGAKSAKKRAEEAAASRAGSETGSELPQQPDRVADSTQPEEGDASVEDIHDEELYCICQTLYDGGRVMLACDVCDQWYHTSCMKIRDDDAPLIERFVCTLCQPKTHLRTTRKTKCKRAQCKSAALLPLSKFCSEACGVAHMQGLIQKSLPRRSTHPLKEVLEKLYGPSVSAARPRSGVPQWVDNVPEKGHPAAGTAGPPDVPPPVPPEGIDVHSPLGLTSLWNQRLSGTGVSVKEGKVFPTPVHRLPRPAQALASFAARHGQLLTEEMEHDMVRSSKITHKSGHLEKEISRARIDLDRILLQMAVVEQQQAVTRARKTLVRQSIDRSKVLPRVEPPEDTGAVARRKGKARPRTEAEACGYDERLAWSDERLMPYVKVSPAWAELSQSDSVDNVDSATTSIEPEVAKLLLANIDLRQAWSVDELEWDELPNTDGTYRDDISRPVKVCTSTRRCKIHAGWQELNRISTKMRQDTLVRIYDGG